MLKDNLSNIDVVDLDTLTISRGTFSCSNESLQVYFQQYVTQDVKKGLSKCFVLVETQRNRIIGYYTLSALSIFISDIPKERVKKAIPYPVIPAVLIGRLAIDSDFQGKGYGQFLIADAINKIKTGNIGAVALVVEAKDDSAIMFYKKLGFVRFENAPKKLFYPLTKIIK